MVNPLTGASADYLTLIPYLSHAGNSQKRLEGYLNLKHLLREI
jgi:hypothetical protein